MRQVDRPGASRGLLPLLVAAVLGNALVVLTAWITGAGYCPGGSSHSAADSTSLAVNTAMITVVTAMVLLGARRSRLSWSLVAGVGAAQLALGIALGYATFLGEAFSCWKLT